MKILGYLLLAIILLVVIGLLFLKINSSSQASDQRKLLGEPVFPERNAAAMGVFGESGATGAAV